MKHSNKYTIHFIISALLIVTNLYSQSNSPITFSEIMFRPAETNGEFVELYNTSETDSIDLTGYKFKYYTSSNNNIESLNGLTKLSPGGYAVIIQGSYDFDNGIYITLIPNNVPIFKTTGKNFGSSGMANSSDRTVSLISPEGDTLDTYTYSADNKEGYSDEKIDLSKDNSQSNWANSKIFNGTPGYKNSAAPLENDIEIEFLGILPQNPVAEDSVNISVVVKNLGTKTTLGYDVKLFLDENLDSTGQSNEIIFSGEYSALGNGDSIQIDKKIFVDEAGNYFLIVSVDYKTDEDSSNNIDYLGFSVSEKPPDPFDIVINEFMYDPPPDQPEWIEIYNRSVRTFNLKNWTVGDNRSKVSISDKDVLINPGNYFVISDDSTINDYFNIDSNFVFTSVPSLNNGGDDVVIRSASGLTVDSLSYVLEWGGGGKSLERISTESSSTDSSNWNSSKDEKGGTPGKINSVSQKEIDAAITKILFNPQKPLAGENVNIEAEIINKGTNDISFNIILSEINRDSSKSQIEETENIRLVTGESKIYNFNYSLNSISAKHTFEVGVNLPDDQDSTNNKMNALIRPGYLPGSLKINEIMFAPLNGEPEWVEFYNAQNYSIDIDGWAISDVLATPQETELLENIIPPKSFFVIAKDSSIFNYHKSITSNVLIKDFANLNNDSDGIVIKDSRGFTIDSVFYDNSWGGESGKSIERISIDDNSNDKTNWASSNDVELSTPGRLNSVTQKDYDLTITNMVMKPELPTFDDNVVFAATVHNIGKLTATQFSVSFYFKNETDTTLFESEEIESLNSLDSIEVFTLSKIKLLSSQKILCEINFPGDQDISNNTLIKSFAAGYKRNDVLISEIMYNPIEGEPEWFEIYNNTSTEINLKDWNASDAISPKSDIITSENSYLPPGEYAIITTDTNSYQFYPPPNFYQSNFGSLGNSSDGIAIHDFRGVLIDSLKYDSDWGGQKGFSLERISYKKESNESSNWGTSLNINGATPGIKNSLIDIPHLIKNDIVINEIMYEPAADNSEFLEFYNTSNDSIQLGGTSIEIGYSKTFKLSETYFVIPPHKFVVLSSDSSIFSNYNYMNQNENIVLINKTLSLPNDGTSLVVKDMFGTTIDSLVYSSGWHNKNIIDTKNISLERLDPDINSNDPSNWSSCVDAEGATPGKRNSIFIESVPNDAKVFVSPNPFSPDNDGFEDFTTINFNLPFKLAQVRIKVFDSVGRLVRVLENNTPSSSKNTVIFDGLDGNGRALRIGIYILLIEAVGDNGSKEELKTPIVIARKL